MEYVRHLSIPGLHNCRDLGGYACDGGRTRFGVFLRSEAPCTLEACGIEALKAYGLTKTVDLRGQAEIDWRPSVLAGELPYEIVPLTGGAETFEKKNLPAGPFSWDKVYIKRAIEHRDWIRDAFNTLVQTDGCVLFHCTTGKDRTGMLTCCLLGAVGVSRADIAADYCLSEVYLQEMFRAMRDGSLTIRQGPSNFEEYVFHCPFQAMEKFYDYFTENFGSVRNYLLDIGVEEGTLEKLKEKFVERIDN